jgi:O-antigen/teichoic acid export membrane protein
MTFHFAALVAVFLLAQLWLAQALPPAARSSLPAYRTREWLGVALPLVFISAMHLALSQIDILMVGILLTPADAGVYAAAARIGAFVIFGLIAVNGIVAPMIARLFTEGHRTALQHMVTLAGRAGLAFALVAALALAVFGDWILSLFGPAFPKGYGALLILVAGQLINAFAGSVGFLMTMTGHERQAAKIMLLSLALNILLNAVLIPVWGLEGAATATAITTALWNLAMLGYVKRRLGIHSSAIRWS